MYYYDTFDSVQTLQAQSLRRQNECMLSVEGSEEQVLGFGMNQHHQLVVQLQI